MSKLKSCISKSGKTLSKKLEERILEIYNGFVAPNDSEGPFDSENGALFAVTETALDVIMERKVLLEDIVLSGGPVIERQFSVAGWLHENGMMEVLEKLYGLKPSQETVDATNKGVIDKLKSMSGKKLIDIDAELEAKKNEAEFEEITVPPVSNDKWTKAWENHPGLASIEKVMEVGEAYLKEHGDKLPDLLAADDKPKSRAPRTDYFAFDRFTPPDPQTKTEQFKRWFGDSKIVTRDGRPKRMYHATKQVFQKFRIARQYMNNEGEERGIICVTPSPKFASDWIGGSELNNWIVENGMTPVVMPIYVRAENPFDFENPAHVEALSKKLPRYWTPEFSLAIEQGGWGTIELPYVLDAIRALGYDGAHMVEGGVKNLLVFNPTQLKSATGNKGDFDINVEDVAASMQVQAVHDVVRAISVDDLFKYPKSAETDMKAIFEEIAPDLTVKEYTGAQLAKSPGVSTFMPFWTGRGSSNLGWMITSGARSAYVNVKGNEVALNIAGWDEGAGGSRIYAAVANWAHNNGKVFIEDPNGLSTEAMYRRLENMLATAMKFGTTRHIAPGDKMEEGIVTEFEGAEQAPVYKVKPLDWVRNNHPFNIFQMMQASYDNVSLMVPEIAGLRYNFASLQFEDENGAPFTAADFNALAATDAARAAHAGPSTLKRTVLFGSVLRAKGNLPGVLGETGGVDALPGNLKGISYSNANQSPPTQVQVGNAPTPNPGGQTPANTLAAPPVHPSSWNVAPSTRLEDLAYKLQDKQLDTKAVQNAIAATGRAIADDINAYQKEELFHGKAAKETQEFLERELRPLLKDMAGAGIKTDAELKEFEKFLWAEHAQERNAQIARINPAMPDGGSGMTNADARTFLAGLDPAKAAAYGQIAQRIYDMNRRTRQLLVAYGLESQDTISAWEKTYKKYVPLFREDMERPPGAGQGISVRGPFSKRAMGSDKDVVFILAHMALQRERAIVRGEKNRVANALYGLARLNPNPDFWKVDQPPTIRYIDPRTNLVATMVDPRYKSSDNVVMARTPNAKGEVVEHAIIFNERNARAMRMAAALKNLDAEQLGVGLAVASKFTRWFAMVNTQYNPIFGVINLIRDVQGGMINLSSTPLAGQQKKVLGYTMGALQGIYRDLRAHRAGRAPGSAWQAEFEEFQKMGGQTGYRDMFSTARERAEAIQREMNAMQRGAPLSGLVAIRDWLTDYNDTMENAVRLAAYKAAKERGLSKERAASLAKNLTVNFNRKGQAATQIGALYAFFNAATQGTTRMYRTLTSPAGKKILLGGLLLGSIQALALAAAGYEDDEPPEFVRDRNVVIPLPGGRYLTFPLPLGFHAIPATSRIFTELALSGFDEPVERLAQLLSMYAEAFNPIGHAGLSLQSITPTIVDPFAALTENKDWTGKPIAQKDFNSLHLTPGHARAKDSASATSMAISKAINWLSGGSEYRPGVFSPTPDQIDYLIGQATGGVGREYLKLETTVTSTITGEDLPAHKVPLFGRFYGNINSQASQAGQFYKNLTEINEHRAEVEGRKEAKEPVEPYLQANPTARLAASAKQFEGEVRKLRKQRREALKAGDKDKVKALDEKITERMTTFNERVKKAKD